MKKLRFLDDVLPHLVAIAVFLVVVIFFFNPIFFDSKVLNQHDINEFVGSSKALTDYRKQTGEEALWTDAMFSGMPAYLISVQWGNLVIGYMKGILALGLPSPANNIFLAFLCYYIMLLAFRVRPYLAIAGAISFGLSSYMIIGVMAGHNARIGAIAFMPLVIAGIHITLSGRKILGAGLTTAAIALHLRENHLQITYYMLIIVLVYGLVRLIEAIREKTTADFLKNAALLIPASLIAAGTFFGQFWAITEYTSYSIRGKSELEQRTDVSRGEKSGLSREYAFRYSNGILEPFTLLIPNFYGGSTSSFLVEDQKSATYQALANAGNEKLANQLINYTSSYWGPQFNTAPYYGGAIMVFLFAVGVAFAPARYRWWLVPVSILGVVLSWGSSFPAFNNFLFDYLPGYNKFRSVTFTLLFPLFAMPLLGLLGVEELWRTGVNKETRRKLLIALSATGGLCLLFLLFAGMFSFTKEVESQLPAWFVDALAADRKSLFRSDAFRSLAFIAAVFILLYFDVHKKITPIGFYAFLILAVVIDVAVVDKRYLKNTQFRRARDNSQFEMTEADQEILRDKSYYRVYNLQWEEAQTSYHHHSIGGYHGAKLKRYQDFYDSCIERQTRQMIGMLQQGRQPDYAALSSLDMLNVKYIVYGPGRDNIIVNPANNGNAWFVKEVLNVKSPTEELAKTCGIDTRSIAVIDQSKFTVAAVTPDSAATISLSEHALNQLKYESNSATNGLAVFSEIYYPKGWKATIDGKEVPVLRADYLLRALEIPAGKHTIEFRFEPAAYNVGNKVTTASSWLVVLILLASVAWSLKETAE